jgi:Pyruvate:ferredoxin oxidoreductase and related 2-oxoacid:ferredoxin oxidoreductases, beta subunit
MTAEPAYKLVFSRPESLRDTVTHYCPGCGHSIAHRLVAECLDELGIREQTIGVPPVGCAVLAYNYFNFDMVEAPHGRALAVATGLKRVHPDKFILTYQGDGDLAAIGMAEIMHAANRGENFTVIFINNSTYGMTGGQMAPTTLVGQKATTAPLGRNPAETGYPMKMCEILSQLEAPKYIARFALDCPANILKAKKGIRKAFGMQMAGKGFTFVELLSNCPTNWGMPALECMDWMRENTMKVFSPGRVPGWR